MSRIFTTLLLAAALVVSAGAGAQNSTSVDGFTIHHNAFTSDTLNPEVAKTYGLQRSKQRALLNVSVIKEKPGTTGESVPARVEVHTVALTGRRAPLPMREIKEQDAVYYIGELSIRDQETVNFDIQVVPEGSEKTYGMRMSEQFFTK
jgi:hypothetical protein